MPFSVTRPSLIYLYLWSQKFESYDDFVRVEKNAL